VRVQTREEFVLVAMQTHVDQSQFLESRNLLAVFDHLRDGGAPDVALVHHDGLDLCLSCLEELSQVLDVLVKVHLLQTEPVEVVPVHVDELGDEVRPEEALLPQVQGPHIVVLEVVLFLRRQLDRIASQLG
jgi:hypothetical protein